jgi:hypothetical protein
MAHRREWTFLVDHALAANDRVRADDDLVPVLADFIKPPERRAYHLAAKLLRERDAHHLGLAVGMVGA